MFNVQMRLKGVNLILKAPEFDTQFDNMFDNINEIQKLTR